jgi:hypothetical protein
MIRNTITDNDISPYLRRRNSIHRFTIRWIEKNRFPVKCSCVICGGIFLCGGIEEYLQRQHYLGPDKNGNIRHVCWGCSLEKKLKITAVTLYQLINALPRAERDRQEIYPADFLYPRIPLWREEKMRLPGIGLRDYSEGTRLLTKYGKYEFAYRQKASPVRDVLTITFDLVDWGRLTPPERQQVLKRIGRLYKNSCWWPKRGKSCLFDKAQASSWRAQQWRGRNKTSIEFDPADAFLLERREWRERWRIARMGGEVQYLEGPFKRHTRLARTRAAYNEQWDSYINNNRLSRTLREQRSLNIPRETIDARNAMIANLERDFAPRRDEARAA